MKTDGHWELVFFVVRLGPSSTGITDFFVCLYVGRVNTVCRNVTYFLCEVLFQERRAKVCAVASAESFLIVKRCHVLVIRWINAS